MADEEVLDPPSELELLGSGIRPLAEGIAVASAGKGVADIFTFDDVQDALFCSVLRYPYLQVLTAGRPAATSDFTMQRRVAGTTQGLFVDGGNALARFEEGNTLVFNALEEWHPASQQLARRLATRAGARVQVTAFCTPAGHTGFARHRDDVHVYAVQTVGSKTWKLSSPAPPDGFEPGLSSAEGSGAEFELTTDQGTVLWMHRGVLHSATASTEISVHVSFTIRRPALSDLVRGVVDSELRRLEHTHLAADPERARRQLQEAAEAVQSALRRADWSRWLSSAAAASLERMPGRPHTPREEADEVSRDG